MTTVSLMQMFLMRFMLSLSTYKVAFYPIYIQTSIYLHFMNMEARFFRKLRIKLYDKTLFEIKVWPYTQGFNQEVGILVEVFVGLASQFGPPMRACP